MSLRPCSPRFAAVAAAAMAPLACAQVHLGDPSIIYAQGFGGMTPLPGVNASVYGSAAGSTISTSFTGDIVASLYTNGAGTFNGLAYGGALTPFTVGELPVMIGDATMHAGFKIVASGGNGVPDGNDPVVTLTFTGRLYQQAGNTPNAFGDPWLSAIEFTRTYVQNGNGLQIIDDSFGPAHSGYILTPGNYYLYQQYYIQTSITTNGGIQPTRGVALEFGGDLSGGTYSGFQYTVDWRTVPAPGPLATLALGGVLVAHRRRS